MKQKLTWYYDSLCIFFQPAVNHLRKQCASQLHNFIIKTEGVDNRKLEACRSDLRKYIKKTDRWQEQISVESSTEEIPGGENNATFFPHNCIPDNKNGPDSH